jgi:hypothetical protein
LEKKHGKLHPLAKVDFSGYGSVDLIVYFRGKQETRTADKGLTVQELKQSFKDFVGYPAAMIKVTLVRRELDWADAENLHSHNLNEKLFQLRVEDGDALHCDLR